jgi:hypothetical protein
MKVRPVALSLFLNFALAGGLVWSLARRPVAPSRAALGQPAVPTTPARAPTAASGQALDGPARTNFRWAQVESADYLTYITNLRRIGCPEETIRDIIVADVSKLFAPRYAALAGTAPELAWWGHFDKRKPVRPELAGQLRGLDEEKKALLARLLNPSAGADLTFAGTTVAAVREQNLLAFLPESRQPAVRDVLSRYEALQAWGRTQWKGLSSDERDARQKELRDARGRELAGLLTPDELRDFDLRDSLTSDLLREEYGQGSLTEAEFRRLYDLRRDFEQRHPETKAEDWKRLEADNAAALGPERFAELQRQNDSMWQAMQDLSSQHGFSSDALSQAYAVKKEYSEKLGEAVGRMFADPQQNPQPLRDLAAEMDARLGDVLGAEAVKQLDRLGVLPRLVIQDDGKRKSYSLTRGGFSE